jgi:hypothetical protein
MSTVPRHFSSPRKGTENVEVTESLATAPQPLEIQNKIKNDF